MFDDVDLLGGIDRDVNDLNLWLSQEIIDTGIDFRDSVVFGSALRVFTVSVGDADNFEPGLFVGGQMRVVDDSSGADNSDSVVLALRQFGFVIEMGKNIR